MNSWVDKMQMRMKRLPWTFIILWQIFGHRPFSGQDLFIMINKNKYRKQCRKKCATSEGCASASERRIKWGCAGKIAQNAEEKAWEGKLKCKNKKIIV